MLILFKTQSNKKTKIHNCLHCVYSILARFLMIKMLQQPNILDMECHYFTTPQLTNRVCRLMIPMQMTADPTNVKLYNCK